MTKDVVIGKMPIGEPFVTVNAVSESISFHMCRLSDLTFFDVRISKPCPHMCHLSDLMYGSFVNVITIYHKNLRVYIKLPIYLGMSFFCKNTAKNLYCWVWKSVKDLCKHIWVLKVKQPSDAEVEKLVQDVEKYTLASHLVFGWVGYALSCDTPEGEACELVKNLALMTRVTTKAH
ncbi:hypothetical protein SDJN02_09401, partial [Cucurbita argyrosperma subsp. argyrosperma]